LVAWSSLALGKAFAGEEGIGLLTYAPAAGAAFVAVVLGLVLIVAPLRHRRRGRRRGGHDVAEALSPERRTRLEQF
jgi:hypothetical protein